MKVRILRSIATRDRAFVSGSVVEVDDKTAKSWILAGLAEQDKSLDGPSEVKDDASETDNTSKHRADNGRRSKNIPQD